MDINAMLTSLVILQSVLVKPLAGFVVEVVFDDLEGKSGEIRSYELGSEIGKGKSGFVSDARLLEKDANGDWQKGKRVAVKVSRIDRDAAELEYAASKIFHNYTNVTVQGLVYMHGIGNLRVDDHKILDGLSVIVMDLVQGITLEAYLEKRDLLNYPNMISRDQSIPEKIRVAMEVMVNLVPIYDFVHGKRITHNDLHRRNIMLSESEEGRPKQFTLIDFGKATLPSESFEPVGDLISLVSQVCWISTVCTITTDDKKPSIMKKEVNLEQGTLLFEALSDVLLDAVKLEEGGQSFDYVTHCRKFSTILEKVEQEGNIESAGLVVQTGTPQTGSELKRQTEPSTMSKIIGCILPCCRPDIESE